MAHRGESVCEVPHNSGGCGSHLLMLLWPCLGTLWLSFHSLRHTPPTPWCLLQDAQMSQGSSLQIHVGNLSWGFPRLRWGQ